MKIITRSAWGARAPRSRATVGWPQRTELVVHYSEGPTSQTVRSIQDFHMDDPDRRWSDIGYNFLVDTSGRIYEGRGWLTVGAHAPGHNSSGIGVCMIGQDGDATAAALRSIRAVYDEACRRAGHQLAKRGHRDVYPTDCPGDQLYAWVRAGMPADIEEDDMKPTDQIPIGQTYADDFGHDNYPAQFTWVGAFAEAKRGRVGIARIEAQLAQLAAKVGAPVDVDEDAIVAGILAGLSPDAIADKLAAALPADIGEQVAQALAERLAQRQA